MKPMQKLFIAVALGASALAASSRPVLAENLIFDGSFSNGLNGWGTNHGFTVITKGTHKPAQGNAIHDADPSSATLHQAFVGAVVGERYRLSFEAAGSGRLETILDLGYPHENHVSLSANYQHFERTYTDVGSVDEIAFSELASKQVYIGDVKVTEVLPVVPEADPETAALVGALALGGLALMADRRAAKKRQRS